MALAFPSVLDHGLERTAAVMTAGFADYLVPIAATPASLLAMVRQDSVEPGLSRVAVQDGEAVGVALVARRGWTSRVAGMAIVPAARRTGVGRALLRRLLEEAGARGDRTVVLEVIEQNAPAVALYEREGFRRMRRLCGFGGRPVSPAGPAAALEPVDPREFGRRVARDGLPDLPWQVSAETLAHAGPPAEAWQAGDSAALISDPAAPTIVIRGLVTAPAARGRGHSLALLQALCARYPGHEWRVPAIFPEEMAPAFLAAGLAPAAISQWQMVRPVASANGDGGRDR